MHENNGKCGSCRAIINLYPNFHSGLSTWFYLLQSISQDAHVSCAGRGREAQEEAFKAGTSRAHYGQSSHNFNLALDIFQLVAESNGLVAKWDPTWYSEVIEPDVESQNTNEDRTFEINWYGDPSAPYKEMPHCEVLGWQSLAKQGLFKLVE
jgi:hypothetical protein